MRTHLGTVSAGVVAMLLAGTPAARADETDNFTCRERPLAESLVAADALVNAAIGRAIERTNRRSDCDAGCLARELQAQVGATHLHRLTWIPHARIAMRIEEHPGIDRCHVRFRDSIYGARPYNQPWLYPFTGRIILLADSIRLSGRVVGIDKINHFLREGLAHWRARDRHGRDIAAELARELGRPGRQFRMTERGLKGLSLTGVLAYSDLAAGYSGFTFWSDLLSIGGPVSYVTWDDERGRFRQQRTFTFADYVTDAWDEAINCSAFDATLSRQVAAALGARAMSCPIDDCARLAALRHAELYVNPACLGRSEVGEPTRPGPPARSSDAR